MQLARLRARAEYLKLLNWKVAWAADKGLNPADASATKVYGTEFALEAYRVLARDRRPGRLPGRGVARGRAAGPARAPGPEPDHLHLRGRHQRDPAGHHRHGSGWACPGRPGDPGHPPRSGTGRAFRSTRMESNRGRP